MRLSTSHDTVNATNLPKFIGFEFDRAYSSRLRPCCLGAVDEQLFENDVSLKAVEIEELKVEDYAEATENHPRIIIDRGYEWFMYMTLRPFNTKCIVSHFAYSGQGPFAMTIFTNVVLLDKPLHDEIVTTLSDLIGVDDIAPIAISYLFDICPEDQEVIYDSGAITNELVEIRHATRVLCDTRWID